MSDSEGQSTDTPKQLLSRRQLLKFDLNPNKTTDTSPSDVKSEGVVTSNAIDKQLTSHRSFTRRALLAGSVAAGGTVIVNRILNNFPANLVSMFWQDPKLFVEKAWQKLQEGEIASELVEGATKSLDTDVSQFTLTEASDAALSDVDPKISEGLRVLDTTYYSVNYPAISGNREYPIAVSNITNKTVKLAEVPKAKIDDTETRLDLMKLHENVGDFVSLPSIQSEKSTLLPFMYAVCNIDGDIKQVSEKARNPIRGGEIVRNGRLTIASDRLFTKELANRDGLEAALEAAYVITVESGHLPDYDFGSLGLVWGGIKAENMRWSSWMGTVFTKGGKQETFMFNALMPTKERVGLDKADDADMLEGFKPAELTDIFDQFVTSKFEDNSVSHYSIMLPDQLLPGLIVNNNCGANSKSTGDILRVAENPSYLMRNKGVSTYLSISGEYAYPLPESKVILYI